MALQEWSDTLYKRFSPVENLRRINQRFLLRKRIRVLYEVLCFVIILFDSFFLFLPVIFPLKSGTVLAIAEFDAVAVLFLWIEFLARVTNADDKLHYVTADWTDIVAIIPFDYIVFSAVGYVPLILPLKIIRLIRIAALLRFSRRIEKTVLSFAERTRLIYGLVLYLLVIIIGAVILFSTESSINPTMSTPDDTLWYMIVTVTSVGYGDVVPVTGLGRMIGVVAMLSAILFTSLVTATTTSALFEKFRKEREDLQERSQDTIGNVISKLDALNEKMEDLRTELNELKATDVDSEAPKR
ncbi:MAG: ion transporter [Halobacteriota archaeon]